jgi:hypothetical protein
LNATLNLRQPINPKLNLFIGLCKLKISQKHIRRCGWAYQCVKSFLSRMGALARGLMMPFLLLHLVAGMLAGAFFRVQTVLVLALLVLVEVFCGFVPGGVGAAVLWAFGAEAMLQFGYLAGVCARSVVGRTGLAVRIMGATSGPSAQSK